MAHIMIGGVLHPTNTQEEIEAAQAQMTARAIDALDVGREGIMDTEDVQTIARHVARTGAFVGATCRICMTVKHPLRDVTEDDGKACATCIKEQRACPGCGADVNGITGCWHDGSGRWHRECAVKAGAAPDVSPWEYVPMVLRRPGP